jgi:hypothetical protein
MRMWEVERLYALVPIGTPVLIYGSPPWGIVEDAARPAPDVGSTGIATNSDPV